MFNIKTSFAIALLSLAMGSAGVTNCGGTGAKQPAQTNRGTSNQSATPKPSPGGDRSQQSGGDLKIMRQGSYNLVGEPFIAVARDAETYQALRGLDDNLPILADDEFKRIAVVAACLGERRTGGYGVEMTRTPDGVVHISETTPPKDAMVTQALTRPYKIVSVPLESEGRLKVEVGDAWRSAMRPYKLAQGEFTMSGGFAGRSEQMRLEGTMTIMRYMNMATLFFDVKGTGGSKARELNETATGIVQSSGEIKLARFNAGSLVEPPSNLLRASGQLTNNENELTLTLESVPSNIADAFQGRGRLSAVATAPPPTKRRATRENVM